MFPNASNNPCAVAPEISWDAVDLTVLAGYEAVQLAGEPDLVVELIDLYVEDARRRLATLRDSLTARDWPALKREIHSLKGSSASLGALQVARVCEEMEAIELGLLRLRLPVLLSWLELELDRAIHIFFAVRQTRIMI